MAVTMAEITKLRNLTSAGLMDCKKALAETNGDIDAAVEILRQKGKAIAAKREDRQASEGCVLAKNDGNFAAIVALCCETDFVAKNAGFVELTQQLLDFAVANRIKSLDELKEATINGQKVADLVTDESGKTGEKVELARYECIEAPAMQVASMNPLAVARENVTEDVINSEYNVAVEKTKEEQVRKAVEAALKKAGLNPNHFDSEDHIESNMAKGWITAEDAAKGRQIMAETAAAKAANLPEQMIKNIAQGRLNKFFKENCLMEQQFISDGELTVGQYLEKSSKGLVAVDFKRVNLNQD